MLIKTITLPNGAVGTRIRIESIDWSHAGRVTANLALYTDASYAAAGRALAIIAQLNLEGATFDSYLAKAVMEALAPMPADAMRSQLYAAAVAEPLRVVVAGLTLDLSDATSDE